MDYQLVLQFSGDSIKDYDTMLSLEDDLATQLGDVADVDGHDVGSGETNIFIITADPIAAFRRSQAALKRNLRMQGVTAAYRPVDGDKYTVIWPEGSKKEFVIV